MADELAASVGHQIATISAPVIDVEGAVVMSVTAAPFSTLSPDEVDVVGSAVRGVSRQIATQLGSGD
jgi:DNA-binding IclR family transcriptional regulator